MLFCIRHEHFSEIMWFRCTSATCNCMSDSITACINEWKAKTTQQFRAMRLSWHIKVHLAKAVLMCSRIVCQCAWVNLVCHMGSSSRPERSTGGTNDSSILVITASVKGTGKMNFLPFNEIWKAKFSDSKTCCFGVERPWGEVTVFKLLCGSSVDPFSCLVVAASLYAR